VCASTAQRLIIVEKGKSVMLERCVPVVWGINLVYIKKCQKRIMEAKFKKKRVGIVFSRDYYRVRQRITTIPVSFLTRLYHLPTISLPENRQLKKQSLR
jgi:hypothetical protein